MRYEAQQWDAAVQALREADEVVIACHVNPDGDALGSLLACSLGLRQLGKKTWPTWGSSNVTLPFAYRFLPGAEALVPPRDIPPAAVFLALDCGAADRLGEVEGMARDAATLINIDHHPGNENFGTINVVVTTASSTAELAAFLLKDAGVSFDRDIATCLYTGVVTDTGRFQYANSTPETLRLAADLLAYGVPAPDIASEVFDSSPFGYLKLLGRMLERATLFEPERFVYSWVTQKDLVDNGVQMDETEKLIDLLRATRAADVAAMFKEQQDGTFRVSLRSRGPVSVGAIARSQGGGGHELAAGFTARTVDDGVAIVLGALRDT